LFMQCGMEDGLIKMVLICGDDHCVSGAF
jgi:hypothetical protein